MKSLATILAILLTSVSFSQSVNLVDYQIEANSLVTDIKITAHSSQVNGDKSLGRIANISESTINLKLNANRDYTVLINNSVVVEIKRADIAQFNANNSGTSNVAKSSAKQMNTTDIAEFLNNSDENASEIVYFLQVGAFSGDNINGYFSEISNIKTENISGSSVVRYMTGNYDNINEATTSLESIKNKGYNDAFIVAYQDGQRISTSTAIALEKSYQGAQDAYVTIK